MGIDKTIQNLLKEYNLSDDNISTNISEEPSSFFSNIFGDKCLQGVDNIVQRGPGVLCWIYIVSVILSQIIASIYSFSILSGTSLLMYNLIKLVNSIITIYFMYNTCYLCQGLIGWVIIMLMHFFL